MFKPCSLFRLASLGQLVAIGIWAQAPLPPSATNLAQLPVAFVKQGKTFQARGQGYGIRLDSGRADIRLLSSGGGTSHFADRSLSIEFAGKQISAAAPDHELSGKINYISGNDPQKWQIGLSTFGRVTYPEIYPGIDVVYYGNQQELEFDLVVKPGADPGAVRMTVRGGGTLSIDHSGALRGGDDLRIGLPGIYQEVNGTRKAIAGHFSITGNNEVAFGNDRWDRTKPLVIDPTITYSNLLGGGLGSSTGTGIALDSSRNILIAGSTSASDFPTVNAVQSNYTGNAGFISKIDPSGKTLIYSTYIGGSFGGSTAFSAIAADSTGAAWATGTTTYNSFPLVHAMQSSGNGALVKLDSAGVLQFSTYLGGSADRGNGIAVDSAGNAYVTGTTYGGFPGATGSPSNFSSAADVFVAKFSSTGLLVFATVLGGTGQDFGNAITVDAGGNPYVTGYSTSSAFTGAPGGGAQPANNGNGDAFVAKMRPDGSSLLYFTFLGGTSSDQGTAIGVDSSLNAYALAGKPVQKASRPPGAAQTALAGATDGFIAKLSPAGNAFNYITYVGGSRQDYLEGARIGPCWKCVRHRVPPSRPIFPRRLLLSRPSREPQQLFTAPQTPEEIGLLPMPISLAPYWMSP